MAPSSIGLEGEDEDAAAHEAGRLQQPGHGGAIQHRAIDRRARRDRDEQEGGAAGDLLDRQTGPPDVLRLDTERPRYRRRVGQRAPELGRALRHPGELQSASFPLQLDRGGPDPEGEDDPGAPGLDQPPPGEGEDGADRRVSRHLDLAIHVQGEDPDPEVRLRGLRRQHEGGLRESHLPRERQHLLGGQPRGLEKHRQLIPGRAAGP